MGTLPASSGGGGDVVSVVALDTTQSTSLWKPTVKLRNLLCTGSCVLFFDSFYRCFGACIKIDTNHTSNIDDTKACASICIGTTSGASCGCVNIIVGIVGIHNRNIDRHYCYAWFASLSSARRNIGINININRHCCYELFSSLSSFSSARRNIRFDDKKDCESIIINRIDCNDNTIGSVDTIIVPTTINESSSPSMLLPSSLSRTNYDSMERFMNTIIAMNTFIRLEYQGVISNTLIRFEPQAVMIRSRIHPRQKNIDIICNCIECNNNRNSSVYNYDIIGKNNDDIRNLYWHELSVSTSTGIGGVIHRCNIKNIEFDCNNMVSSLWSMLSSSSSYGIVIMLLSSRRINIFTDHIDCNNIHTLGCTDYKNNDEGIVVIVLMLISSRRTNDSLSSSILLQPSSSSNTSTGIGGVIEITEMNCVCNDVEFITSTYSRRTGIVTVTRHCQRQSTQIYCCKIHTVYFGFDLLYNVHPLVPTTSIFHQVPRNTHTDDVLLRVSKSLILQVGIYNYVIAFLHDILHSFSIPSVFQAKFCIHVVAILHNLLGSLLVLVAFNFRSPASLSCNPYLGSRGYIRRLLQVVYRRGINNTRDVEDTIGSIVAMRHLHQFVCGSRWIQDTRDVKDSIRSIVTSNIDTSSEANDTNSSVIVTGCGIHDTSIAVNVMSNTVTSNIFDDAISSTVTSNIDTSSEANDTNSSVIVTGCGIHDTSIAVNVMSNTVTSNIFDDAISSTVTSNIDTSSEANDTNSSVIVTGCGIHNTSIAVDAISSTVTSNIFDHAISSTVTSNIDTSSEANDTNSSVIVTRCGIHNTSLAVDDISSTVTSNIDTHDCIINSSVIVTGCGIHDTNIAVGDISSTVTSNIDTNDCIINSSVIVTGCGIHDTSILLTLMVRYKPNLVPLCTSNKTLCTSQYSIQS